MKLFYFYLKSLGEKKKKFFFFFEFFKETNPQRLIENEIWDFFRIFTASLYLKNMFEEWRHSRYRELSSFRVKEMVRETRTPQNLFSCIGLKLAGFRRARLPVEGVTYTQPSGGATHYYADLVATGFSICIVCILFLVLR